MEEGGEGGESVGWGEEVEDQWELFLVEDEGGEAKVEESATGHADSGWPARSERFGQVDEVIAEYEEGGEEKDTHSLSVA